MKKLFSLIGLVASIILIAFIITLGILPTKYLLIIIGILLVINLIGFLFITRKNIICTIIGFLIVICLCIGSGIGIYYVNTTNKLFSNLTEVKEKSLYYVVINKSSNYKELKDLNNKLIGTMKSDTENYKKALNEIDKTIKVTHKDYDNSFNMFTGLLDNSLDGILINSNNYEIICENNETIKNDTKVLDEISIDVIKQKEKEYKNSKGTFSVLISGIDTNGNISKVSRSDVNIIMTVNPNTHEILLTNIPRDMEVKLHGIDGLNDKLTHAGIYGVDMTKSTLEDFLETDIKYYIRVNFDSVVEIIDSIGGIDIYNDHSFNSRGVYFAEGNIHLNGDQTLKYCRDRFHQANGDWDRGQNQMKVVMAMIDKISHSKELLTNYSSFVEHMGSFVQTNVEDSLIKKYVKKQLDDMSSWNVYNNAVAGTGFSYQETYSTPGIPCYVTHPEEASRAYSSRLINGILNGKEYNNIK